MSHRTVRRAAAGGLVAAALAAMVAAAPAHATLPGVNGKITYTPTFGEIDMLNADGTHSPFVAGQTGAWAPDGSRFAYTDPHTGGITAVRADGSDPVHLTDTGGSLAWTADGAQIIYALNGTLRFVAADGSGSAGDLNENPDTTRYQDSRPAVSSRNDIVFERYEPGAGRSVYRYNGPGDASLLIANATAPDFSPDGTKIAYESGVDQQLWVANADGTAAQRLTDYATGVITPRWSPDGSTILFTLAANGQLETVPSDGSSASPTSLGVTGSDPEWQPIQTNSVDRVWGQNAIGTGIAASQWNYADFGASDPVRVPAKAVVLSRSDAFYDALAGSALAINKQAPLLITPSSALDSGVEAEIRRVLGTSGDVYLLGGTAALSTNIEDRLQTLGYSTHRLAGANVFETAIAIDNEIMRGATPTTAIVATGMDYYDALAAGAAAGANPGTVIVLSFGDSMPSSSATYLNGLNPDRTNMVAVGGPGKTALTSAYYAGMMPSWPGLSYQALVGNNAMDTALDVAHFFFAAPPMAAVSTFNGWYDALTGGAMSGLNYGPLLLTTPDGLYGPVADYLSQNAGSMWDTVIMGGTAALPLSLQSPLGEAISAPGQWMYNDYPAIVGGALMKPRASTIPSYGPKSTDVRHVVPGLSTTWFSKHIR